MSSKSFEIVHNDKNSTIMDINGLHSKMYHSENVYTLYRHKSHITYGLIQTQGLGYDEQLTVVLPPEYDNMDANRDVDLMLFCNCPIADGYTWYNIAYFNLSAFAPANTWYKNNEGHWQCDDLYAYCLIREYEPNPNTGEIGSEWTRMYVTYLAFA